MEIVRTERLRLRTATPDDTVFYHALVNDPAFIEHIGDRGIRTLDDARQALLAGPVAMQEERGHSLYVVELSEGGFPDGHVPIGMCGLIKRDTLDEIDIGYAYLPDWRGQGYAYEAARAVLAYAPTIGIRKLVAIVSPNNQASNGLLRKLGMAFVEFRHLVPGDAGSNLYSIEF
ncbi:GNAT family N-acetyltransferase [Massilia aerilata]|uniref:GNAT family N-acetyltransferase n=1 Tax=Massilia aerilata TaxID=453817 RepID=A0ABW0RXU3_9BURK